MEPSREHHFRNTLDKLQHLSGKFLSIFSRDKKELYALTPDSAIKNNRFYVKCLKRFIRTRAVKNIALSGDYGVGKSSVIELFRKSIFSIVRKTKVISLLTLPEDTKESNTNSDTKDTIPQSKSDIRKNIQREIFRQLYYSKRPGSLYLSRYSRIGKFPILIYSVLIMTASVLLNVTVAQFGLDTTHITPNTFLVGFPLCLTLAIPIHLLALRIEKFIQNISVMKIGAGGLSLDLAKNSPDFEEAADEFIYYFRKTGCRIVVLEDLDRFKDPRIYEELRQLNTLINGAKHIHHKIVFIYALKDSLISAPEDRTKLFDAIVPIVPFITQDNVLQKVRKVFQQSSFTEAGVMEVCKVIARRTKDMRTIKAIHNTAVVMRTMLGGASTKLRDAEIVAIATIHEMTPSQYEELRKGKSELDAIYRNCLNNKNIKITNLTNKIKERGNVPSTMLASAKTDLWALITQPMESDKNYTFSSAQRNSSPFTKELINEDFWLDLIKNRSAVLDITYTNQPYYSNKHQQKTISIERAKSTSTNIGKLIDLLTHDEDYYKKELEDLLERDIFQEMESLKDYDDENTSVTEELILAGAIDESYKLYLSPLSDIPESVELRTFRIRCLSSRTTDFGFKLSNDDIETLLNEASLIDLRSPAFYNHYIINWLIEHKDDRLDKILNNNPRTAKQLLKFFNWECCQNEDALSKNYGDTIDGSIMAKGSLSIYIEVDYILNLTQRIAKILPEELLLVLSNDTNLKDSVSKEVIFIITILSIQEPSKIKFSTENKDIIGSFLDYYEDTIILNGGSLQLAELRIANSLPTPNLKLYRSNENAKNMLISNMAFKINTASLSEISVDTLIQKLESDGLSSETLAIIIRDKNDDPQILTYCLERPDISVSLTDQTVNTRLIQLACKYKIKLQKEQILNLINNLSNDQIIDLMLASDLLWDDYADMLTKLGKPYENIQLGKRPVLPNTNRSWSLINKLKTFNVISSGPTKEFGSLRFSMRKQV